MPADDPDAQLALAGAHAEELAELEERRARRLLTEHETVAAGHERRFVALWLELFEELDYTPTPDELEGFLRRYRGGIPTAGQLAKLDPTSTARNVAADAAQLAGQHAALEAGERVRPPRPGLVVADPRLVAGITSGRDVVGQLLARLRALGTGEELKGTHLLLEQRAAFGVARARAEGVTRWSANAGANRARALVTEELGIGKAWVNERDACVHCLAYAGQVAGPEGFELGLSFDPRGGLPAFRDELPEPPLHPRCRCSITPWSMAWGSSLPDALKREAERSVLRGWALPSETEAARARAAAELLEQGPAELDVRSVERGAERDLKAGTIRKPVPGRP